MIWLARGSEDVFQAYIDESLERDLIDLSQTTDTFPTISHCIGGKVVYLELITEDGDGIETEHRRIGDFGMSQTSIDIFSERARNVAVALGALEDDFLECRFRTSNDRHFMFLPMVFYEVIDGEKTTFAINRPLPLRMLRLYTKDLPEFLPPCFKSRSRGDFVYGETFVTDEFKRAWERERLIGIAFTDLTK